MLPNSAPTKLQAFPSLRAWYEQHRGCDLARAPASEAFAWRMCDALSSDGEGLVERCVSAFAALNGEAADVLNEFLAAESLFQSCGAPLLEILGQVAEDAIHCDRATPFREAMTSEADTTGLVVFRFLAAWTALNSGQHDECIKECEKVDEPHGSVYTLHGQALLESGRVDEAIEVLNVAVKLTPSEILAWFQLAKAYHVAGQGGEAWKALAHCRKLAPQSAEVALFLGRVALEPGALALWQDEAFAAARPYLTLMRSNSIVVCTAFRLACCLKDRTRLEEVIQKGNWSAFLSDRLFLTELPDMLRQMQALGWHDLARDWLGLITPPGQG